MYLLEVDSPKNRIHITFTKRLDEAQSRAILNEIKDRIGEVQDGFSVLCDMTTLTDIDKDAKRGVQEIMDFCNARKVGKVIRIVANPLHDFGLTIMSCFHYDSGVSVVTCKTLEEALEHL
ncbi:MAG: hypothetical protein JXR25_09140 [Pontiellaceae bacterium]|nr:hypothetical protein [Pontiellaceae bacterium]MBN2784981.1 hypothetical protein [Pontiellaceae bacterium]